MRIEIRKGVFETNSSSTHAINIYRTTEYHIPENIYIQPGEFGWECDTYYNYDSKLSYIWTWILSACYENDAKIEEYKERIIEKLKNLGVKEIEFIKCEGWDEDGYIDHSENLLEDDLETILESYFADFIFGDNSYVETGNDNDNYEVDIDSKADFSIYKGN